MIDTDKYEGHTPAPWKTGGYNVQAIQVWTVDGLDETQNWIQVPMADRLLAVDAPLLLEEVKRLNEQYTELREALVGDSPNWTHEELIEKALDVIDKARAWDIMVDVHTSDSENDWVITELMVSILKEVKQ